MGNNSYVEYAKERDIALITLLDLVNSQARFTPEEFIEAMLQIINERDPLHQTQLWLKIHTGRTADPEWLTAKPEVIAAISGPAREALEEWLTIIKDGNAVQRLALAKELARSADQMALVPRTRVERSTHERTEITREYVWMALNSTSAVAAGLLELLKLVETRKKTLCRCKLESCGGWFIAKREDGKARGVLRNVYCSKDHAQDADRIRKREAAVVYRKKKRLEKNKRRKPK